MAKSQAADTARPIIMRSITEASARRDRSVEAEHLLLAILHDPKLSAARALTQSRLTIDWWQKALTAERRETLRSAGVDSIDDSRLDSTPSGKRPIWGASGREALKRGSLLAVERGHHHRMDDVDIALGVLGSPLGTIARVAARNDLDVAALVDQLRAA